MSFFLQSLLKLQKQTLIIIVIDLLYDLFYHYPINEIREMNQKEFGESTKHVLIAGTISFST